MSRDVPRWPFARRSAVHVCHTTVHVSQVAEKAMAGVDRSKSSEGEVSRLQARLHIVSPYASHGNPDVITHELHRNRVAMPWPSGRRDGVALKYSHRNRAALVLRAGAIGASAARAYGGGGGAVGVGRGVGGGGEAAHARRARGAVR